VIRFEQVTKVLPMETDLRATADHLFMLADQARGRGNAARATALERIAEDYEAEIAAQERGSSPRRAAAIPDPRSPV
jgi:propanediol dehydratase small subunit